MNLEELKAKALATTPGPWAQATVAGALLPEVDCPQAVGFIRVWTDWTFMDPAEGITDAAFIAAADPQTVLALVRAIEGISLLHVPDQYGACLGCGTNESGYATVRWPCETAAIIEELEGEE